MHEFDKCLICLHDTGHRSYLTLSVCVYSYVTQATIVSLIRHAPVTCNDNEYLPTVTIRYDRRVLRCSHGYSI